MRPVTPASVPLFCVRPPTRAGTGSSYDSGTLTVLCYARARAHVLCCGVFDCDKEQHAICIYSSLSLSVARSLFLYISVLCRLFSLLLHAILALGRMKNINRI